MTKETDEEVTKEKLDGLIAELKKQNAEAKELLDRREIILAAEQTAGLAQAGEPQKEPEETPKEYADRIMRGGK